MLAAAETGRTHHSLTGHERALLYRLAVETGLRWSELRSLSRASFDFNAEPATVTIAAAYAKNGEDDTLPLRNALAVDLKEYMALFLPGALAFAKMGTDCGAEMIRDDLETAGVITRDENGEMIISDQYGLVYDFHGLRHTFATLLNRSRVPLATAQKLMRHSDPKLTAEIYTHVLVDDKADELAKLPEIAAIAPKNEVVAKTGTIGDQPGPFLQVRNSADRPGDSFATDSDRQITTYSDADLACKTPNNSATQQSVKSSRNLKAPATIEVAGASKNWWEEMDSNHRRAGPDRFTVCSLWPLGHLPNRNN